MGGSVRGRGGGILSLLGVLRDHGEAVEYDLLRCGLRLDWLPSEALTWHDLGVIVRQATPETATYRSRNPKTWQRSIDAELLVAIDYRIQALLSAWGGPRPALISMPWDESDVTKPDEQDWDDVVAQMTEHNERRLRLVG